MSGWVAGAVVGGALISGVASNSAADTQAEAAGQASDAQAKSAAEATALQREMWQQQVAAQKPWQEAGVTALNQLAGYAAPSKFNFGPTEFAANQDPGYAFRLSEGVKSLDASAASRGGLLSGNALRGAVGYGQEMGSQEYQNAYNRALTGFNANRLSEDTGYNRLASQAGLGQTANQQVGQAGQSYANQVGNITTTAGANQGNALLAAGNANASSYQGWGNAAGQALQGLSKINWNPTSSTDLVNTGGFTNTPSYMIQG